MMNETDIWARECLQTISIVNEWSEDRIIKLILACQDVSDEDIESGRLEKMIRAAHDVSDEELDLAIEAGGIIALLESMDAEEREWNARGYVP